MLSGVATGNLARQNGHGTVGEGAMHSGGYRDREHQPALDGVRAVAVVMVLAFHLGIPWASGGYLGVSVFFTLSGFLITSLLLRERERTGRVDLRRFYVRRVRRLIPASTLALLAVVLLTRAGLFATSSRLRDEVAAAAFQSHNWYQALRGSSYADLFSAPSPVAHFWSLGIEEQFYWVWPLLVLGFTAHRWSRRASSALRPIVVCWVVASASAPLTARLWSPDAAYFASWARASEILAGGALAAWLIHRPAPRWWGAVALPALGLVLLAGALTPSGRGFAFDGGLPVFGLVSAALIAGLQIPTRTTRALSIRPLVALGRISYGVYLYHWPIFLLLDAERTGWSGARLHAVRVLATLVAAAASYRLVERPIREGARPRRATSTVSVAALAAGVAAAAAFALITVSAIAPPAPAVLAARTASASANLPDHGQAPELTASDSTWDPNAGSPAGGQSGGRSATSPIPTSRARPTSVAVFGDSVPAWLLRDAAAAMTRTDVVVANGAGEACDGMIDLPVARDRLLRELTPPPDCEEWPISYPGVLTSLGAAPDAAVLVLGQAPGVDHLVEGAWTHPCTTTTWYLDDVRARVAFLRRQGLTVLFALPAHPGQHIRFMFPDDATERMTCVRDDLRALMTELRVPVIDLDDALCPEGDCDRLRSIDGLHVDAPRAPEVFDWLLDEVLARLR